MRGKKLIRKTTSMMLALLLVMSSAVFAYADVENSSYDTDIYVSETTDSYDVYSYYVGADNGLLDTDNELKESDKGLDYGNDNGYNTDLDYGKDSGEFDYNSDLDNELYELYEQKELVQIAPLGSVFVSNFAQLLNEYNQGHTEFELFNTITIPAGNHTFENINIFAHGGGFIIGNGATLNLNNVTLFDGMGTGITINNGGTLILNGANSEVSGFMNRGVRVNAGGTFIMEDGSIKNNFHANFAGWGGPGVYVVGAGSFFQMNGGTISDHYSNLHGGGVVVRNGGNFEMNGGIIENNVSAARGGNVFVVDVTAMFTMNGGVIRSTLQDTVATNGGGVNIEERATFNMTGGTITRHNISGQGAGVHSNTNGVFNMTGGRIYNNEALRGGGVWVNGTFNLGGGVGNPEISNNKARDGGGGVFILGGNFTMMSGEINNNNAITLGGGVFLATNNPITGPATLMMHGGQITNNEANSGGGVSISGNTATAIISGDAQITNNTVNIDGGGIFLNGINSSLIMNGGLIDNNEANRHGGGIHLLNPTSLAYINSNSIISNNAAGRNGGGIALSRYGLTGEYPNLALEGQVLTISGGNIVGNTAANGGGLGFDLANIKLSTFEQYMMNINISDNVIFNANVATAGSSPNSELHSFFTDDLGQIIPVYVTQNHGTGAFTNHYIHTPTEEDEYYNSENNGGGNTGGGNNNNNGGNNNNGNNDNNEYIHGKPELPETDIYDVDEEYIREDEEYITMVDPYVPLCDFEGEYDLCSTKLHDCHIPQTNAAGGSIALMATSLLALAALSLLGRKRKTGELV